jgi:hypothetical protein
MARRRHWLAAVAVVVASLCPLPCAGQAALARIHGLVVDARSGKPVAAALVRTRAAGIQAETSSRGRFTLPGVGAGDHEIVVERLGYGTRVETVSLKAGDEVDLTIHLETRPIPLKPIEVVVRSGRLGEVGFYDRRDNGGLSGRYITREVFERRNAVGLTDVLVGVQGVKVFPTEPGRTTVRFNRHVPEEPGPGQQGTGYAMQGGLDPRGCEPDLYIDGRLHRYSSPPMVTGAGGGIPGVAPARNKVDDFNAVPVSEIEGVEIYVGAAVPVFVRNTACGVILIWTRR